MCQLTLRSLTALKYSIISKNNKKNKAAKNHKILLEKQTLEEITAFLIEIIADLKVNDNKFRAT